jgi:hypothetical protein
MMRNNQKDGQRYGTKNKKLPIAHDNNDNENAPNKDIRLHHTESSSNSRPTKRKHRCWLMVESINSVLYAFFHF